MKLKGFTPTTSREEGLLQRRHTVGLGDWHLRTVAANPTHMPQIRKISQRKTSHMLSVEHNPHFKIDLLGYPLQSSAPNQPLSSISEISASCISPPKNTKIRKLVLNSHSDLSFILLDVTENVQTIFILISFN